MGTKAQAQAAGRRSLVITLDVNGHSEKCLLKNVLNVPEFEYLLIPVSIIDSLKVHTTFRGGKCTMTRSGKTIATGNLTGSLYILDFVSSKTSPGTSAETAEVQYANIAALGL